MWNWIIDNKEWLFSGIGVILVVALVSFGISYINSKRAKRKNGSDVSGFFSSTDRQVSKKRNFEILPLSFDITLQQEIPRISIWLYVINYLNRTVNLDSLTVTQFNFSGGPTLENIDKSGEIVVPALKSTQVLLRRALSDAEARAIARNQTKERTKATFNAIVKASAGRKKLTIDTSSISVAWWIEGIKSES